ncbi:MAG: rhodanese-like domain-containing protein [Rubricoccaceae bacterium]
MSRSLSLAALIVLGAGMVYYMTRGGGESTTPNAAVEAIQNGAFVIDARTADEFASGHIAGALNVDVLEDDFRQRVDDLDRDEPVYIYCRSGNRSGRAATILEEMGFSQVVNAGGFSALASAGAPVEG